MDSHDDISIAITVLGSLCLSYNLVLVVRMLLDLVEQVLKSMYKLIRWSLMDDFNEEFVLIVSIQLQSIIKSYKITLNTLAIIIIIILLPCSVGRSKKSPGWITLSAQDG